MPGGGEMLKIRIDRRIKWLIVLAERKEFWEVRMVEDYSSQLFLKS